MLPINLPPEITNLATLKVLDVSGNPYKERGLPNYISALTGLKILNVSSCELTTLPEELILLPNLQEINVDDKSLTSLPPFDPRVKVIGFTPPKNPTPHV